MMEEWIKKDSALEICDRWRRRAKEAHDRDGFYIANIIHEQTEELIDARPQGEWIPATWQDEHCPERLKKHKCSVCGHRAETVLVKAELVDNYYCNKAEPITKYTHKEQLSKYCPNCGARMKELINE